MSFGDWFRPRKMLVLVLGTMMVLASIAGWLVWRFAEQDRTLQGQQTRERLESAADLVAAKLREGLSDLESRLETLSSLDVDDGPAAAARIGAELAKDSVIVLVGPHGVSAYPKGRLVYHPALPDSPGLPPDTFAEGERLEFRTREHDQAIATFRRQAVSTDLQTRAGALLRVARVQRKAGRFQDALATYDELGVLGAVPVESLPAELLARHARCAVLASQGRLADLRTETERLQELLLAGAWTIGRGTFLHYMEESETFLRRAAGHEEAQGPEPGRDIAPTAERVRQRIPLATGVEILWQEWNHTARRGQSGVQRFEDDIDGRMSRELEGTWMLLLWQNTDEKGVGLVGGPNMVWQELIAPLEPLLARQAAAVMIGDGAGQTLVRAGFLDTTNPPDNTLTRSDGTRAAASRVPRARRTRAESGLPWELQVVSADPHADRAAIVWRQRILLTVSGLVVLLVVAAMYVSSRAVARELDVARLRAEFVSAVSHDFRTPLTSLRQVTEALAGERVAADRRPAYYGIQLRAIDRLHRLVEGLLDFGRIEAGAHEFEQRPVQVRAWVEGVVRAFQAEVDKQGFTIELSWSGPDPVIEGDEPALTRALWNLLDNAVKYSPACKTVWVDGRVSDARGGTVDTGRLVLSVRDRGVGVDPTERRTIFGKFVRGSAAAASATAGTGLGLAMVEHIVRAHGGEVEVDGSPGHGSTFSIRLPLGNSST